MKKIAVIYWPKKGNTEKIAARIYEKLGEHADLFTIRAIKEEDFSKYDAFIIGAPTTGADNWEHTHKTHWIEFFGKIAKAGIQGRNYAIFGLGDQVRYPYHFVDGMIEIRKEFDKNGAKRVGSWSVEGYDFKESDSIIDGRFVGLALDEDNEAELSEERINKWLAEVRKGFGI